MDEPLRLDDVISLARPIVDRIVYASVTTVSHTGEPRSRVVHPVWRWADDGLTGWIGVRPTSLMLRHLPANPHVSCAYWSPAHDAVYIDGTAHVAPPDELHDAWQSMASATGPTAFDPFTIFPGGPEPGVFNAVVIEAHRIRVVEAARLPTGGPYRAWTHPR